MAENYLQDLGNKKWSIISFTLVATLTALVVSLFLPREYVSQASLLPANSKLMDQQRLFGTQVQELYSAYGSPEDLDRLFATMRSGAVLHRVAEDLALVNHYGFSGKKNARQQAQKKLEKNTKMIRSEYGELRLSVWDEDPAMAEKIASAIIARTQAVFDEMFNLYYDRSIGNLSRELARVKADTTNITSRTADLEKRIAEYEVTKLDPPAAFFVMEKPAVSTLPDKPNYLLNLGAAFLASLFTALAWLAARRSL
jgi:uncharacterized protein involved in exopolysaccharide biosynthesis